jgi:ribosome-binding factor A
MPGYRIKKVNEMIKKALADILLKDISFKKQVLVTISRVDVSSDLKNAKVWISVYPFLQKGYVINLLRKKRAFIQKLLGEMIKIKFTPKLDFMIDPAQEEAEKINELFEQIKE